MKLPDLDDGWILKFGIWIVTGIVALAGSLFGWLGARLVKKHDDEIKAIKEGLSKIDNIVRKLEVDMPSDYLKRGEWERNRQETRSNLIGLHQKIEASANALHAKIDTAQSQTNSRLDQILTAVVNRSARTRSSD